MTKRMTVKRGMTALAATAAAGAMVAAIAPTASATTVNTGWNNGTCYSDASLFPIIVNNYSDTEMTGSYTLPSDMSVDIQFYPTLPLAQGSYGCSPAGTDSVPTTQGTYTSNFSVSPFSQVVMWAVVAPTQNRQGFSNYFSIGGAPSGQRGAGWFDFSPSFPTASGRNFTIASVYSGTGGTNGSNQDNFNVTNCVTSNGTVTPGTNILTPYSRGQASGPSYAQGQAMCFAWFPQGTMTTDYTATGAQGTTVQAAQTNNWKVEGGNSLTGQTFTESGTTISFAGTSTGPLTNVAYVITGTGTSVDGVSTSLGSGIGSGAGFVQSAATNDWAAVNLPLSGSTGTLTLTVNGQAVASYAY